MSFFEDTQFEEEQDKETMSTKFAPSLVHNFESLNYDSPPNEITEKKLKRETKKAETKTNLKRWVICFFIGIFTATVAFLIDYFVHHLSEYKFKFSGKFITDDCIASNTKCFFKPFFAHVGFSLGMVLIAGFLTFLVPVAKGSGIPEIKSFMNGVKVPKVVRFSTLVSKAIGVLFAVAGGLTVGKEGPMIHSGAVIAAGISQGKTTTFKRDYASSLKEFRNDQEKLDFVASGAAAGVASAFGAPIGGVLFALEEGASYWNQPLTWRVFFSAMSATFFLNFLLSGTSEGEDRAWGNLYRPGLISFGDFSTKSTSYNIATFPLFLVVGVVGGLFGAVYNSVNIKITKFRRKYITSRRSRFLEVILVGIVTSVFSYVCSFALHSCHDFAIIPGVSSGDVTENMVRFCPKGFYNDLGSIFFETQEQSIKNLFHFSGVFSNTSLIIFGLIYFFISAWTYGISVPSGLFVPVILFGASYGRLLGRLFDTMFPDLHINTATFALIGSASSLGGVMRMTVSLCVILLEATNEISYGLPIMCTIMCAKLVGDFFNHGIYDMHLQIAHVPFLEWDTPHPFKKKYVKDVMNKDIKSFNQQVTLGEIHRILTTTSHNAFPVVNRKNKFTGLVRREDLVALIKKATLMKNRKQRANDDMNEPLIEDQLHQSDNSNSKNVNPNKIHKIKISVQDLMNEYPRFTKIEHIQIQRNDLQKIISLKPITAKTPYTVNYKTYLPRAYRLFRTLGIRHLPCTDENNKVIGMITRKDIMEPESDSEDSDNENDSVSDSDSGSGSDPDPDHDSNSNSNPNLSNYKPNNKIEKHDKESTSNSNSGSGSGSGSIHVDVIDINKNDENKDEEQEEN
ncbi:chloride channel protein clc family member [Anaeramoeba flamelloides]|uniref:Chloride channel protein n=1 Tax=Anaeramoeba flamelloides TaxID=1746091 RepID=A0AAV7YQF2_9EUKA|nr:chloride channel protein clc family member [Anaeramoeba flamelloides]